MISQCMNEIRWEQLKFMIFPPFRKNWGFAQNNGVEYYDQVQLVAKPCQNKELFYEQKKHDKRDKRNTNECLSTRRLCYESWQTPLSP